MTDVLNYLPGSRIDVVLLCTVGNHTVPLLGTTPFDLNRGTEPTQELLSELLGSTVRVTTNEGIPGGVLAVLENTAVPPAFRVSPWLADSRPVIIREDGTGQIGDLPVRYTDDHGLQILYPETMLDADDDDDWNG